MQTKTETISNEAGHLADAAHDLVAATAEVARKASVEVRKQLEAVVDRGRVYYDRAFETAADGARAADEAVHRQPYKSLAITPGIGVIFGLLFARRRIPKKSLIRSWKISQKRLVTLAAPPNALRNV